MVRAHADTRCIFPTAFVTISSSAAHTTKIEDARTSQWLRNLNEVTDPVDFVGQSLSAYRLS